MQKQPTWSKTSRQAIRALPREAERRAKKAQRRQAGRREPATARNLAEWCRELEDSELWKGKQRRGSDSVPLLRAMRAGLLRR